MVHLYKRFSLKTKKAPNAHSVTNPKASNNHQHHDSHEPGVSAEPHGGGAEDDGGDTDGDSLLESRSEDLKEGGPWEKAGDGCECAGSSNSTSGDLRPLSD